MGYIPKSWRAVAGKLEPVSQPEGPFTVPALPTAIAQAEIHSDTIIRVGTMLGNLAGRECFTLQDVAHAAGLDAGFFNTPRGSVEFRAVMKRLLLSGRIVAGTKGPGGGQIAARIESAAAELEGLDF